jgi:hypothetical protein
LLLVLLLQLPLAKTGIIGDVDLSKYKPGQELDICFQLIGMEDLRETYGRLTDIWEKQQQEQEQQGPDYNTQLLTASSSSSLTSALPAGHADTLIEQEVIQAVDDAQNTTTVNSTTPPYTGPKWRFNLENLRFVLNKNSARVETAAVSGLGVPAGMPGDTTALSSTAAEPARYEAFKPTANMLDLERRMRAATIQVGTSIEAEGKWGEQASPQSSSNSRSAAAEQQQQQQQAWWKLQQKYGWADGQVVFKSLYAHCPVKPGECAESCG